MKKAFLPIGIIFLIILNNCSSQKFTRNPVDDMIRDMSADSVFSIILFDIDEEGTFFKTYKHKYRVISEVDGLPQEKTTGWYEVSKEFFYKHENDMGMEIASKSGGKVNKVDSPPGYSNYVGNSRYGHWDNSGGSSFWVFYGQYAFMRSMFNLGSQPVYRTSYNDYNRSYRGSKSYYGPKTSSGATYGTKSVFARKTNPSSSWNTKLAQRSRSGTRYSSSSSSRSRSSGFGK